MIHFFSQLRLRNETLFYFGLLCFVLAALFLLLTRFTATQVHNVNAWYKPFKFAISICVYAWTMAWYCYYLPAFNVRLFNWSIVLLLGFEIVYIAIQAGRGMLSHFNVSTPFYGALYAAMGIAASLVAIYTAYIGTLFFNGNFSTLPTYYVWAIRLGIVLFVIFSFQGFLMGARLSHTVGGSDGSNGIAIVNWSKQLGDLRVAHFIGMHALQVLPILSFYLLKNTRATIAVALLYGILALYTLVVALNGKPLFPVHT